MPCCYCLNTATNDLKTCTRCLEASYCSKECQIADWKANHKAECSKLKIPAELEMFKSYMQQVNANGRKRLDQVPFEIILQIGSFLPFRSFMYLSKTCKAISQLQSHLYSGENYPKVFKELEYLFYRLQISNQSDLTMAYCLRRVGIQGILELGVGRYVWV